MIILANLLIKWGYIIGILCLKRKKKIRSNYKLGCLFEAFLGALFLDANQVEIRDTSNYFSSYMKCGIGFQICQIFVEQVFEQIVDWNELLENDDNYKKYISSYDTKEFKTTPEYVVLNIDKKGIQWCVSLFE